MIDLPKVTTTKNGIQDYDIQKIIISLKNDLGISEKDSMKIAEVVTRKIITDNIKYVSGPHIREIICTVLPKFGYERKRALYTTIGMSEIEFNELISNGHTLQEMKDYIWERMNFQHIGLRKIYNNF